MSDVAVAAAVAVTVILLYTVAVIQRALVSVRSLSTVSQLRQLNEPSLPDEESELDVGALLPRDIREGLDARWTVAIALRSKCPTCRRVARELDGVLPAQVVKSIEGTDVSVAVFVDGVHLQQAVPEHLRSAVRVLDRSTLERVPTPIAALIDSDGRIDSVIEIEEIPEIIVNLIDGELNLVDDEMLNAEERSISL